MRLLNARDIEQLADRAERFASARKTLLLSLYLGALSAGFIWLSSDCRFWFDELFTYYVASLPSASEIWRALAERIDQQPLPFYLVTRFFLELVPDPHVGARIPAVLGFLLTGFCVFHFVERRTSTAYGFVAVSGLFLTSSIRYGFEARPYGLVMGFAALALLAWQRAGEQGRRWWWLVVLALAVAAAISSNYYAVLIGVSLVIGELVRTLERKRIDWPVWLALALGGSVSFVYLPLVVSNVSHFTTQSFAAPAWSTIPSIYSDFLYTLPLTAWPLVVIIALCQAIRSEPNAPIKRGLTLAEVAAAVGLLLLPAVGTLTAMAATKMITARYMLPAVVGVCILFGAVSYVATRGSALAALGILAVLSSYQVVRFVPLRDLCQAREQEQTQLRPLLEGQPADLPVAVDAPLLCLEMMHYERPDITDRLYYLYDPEASAQYAEIPYRGTAWGRKDAVLPRRGAYLPEFRASHGRYLLMVTPAPQGFLYKKLIAEGVAPKELARRGGYALYLVEERPAK